MAGHWCRCAARRGHSLIACPPACLHTLLHDAFIASPCCLAFVPILPCVFKPGHILAAGLMPAFFDKKVEARRSNQI